MSNYKQYTLIIIEQGNKVLLGYKKRGFGQGKWNGFGGKVEKGETIENAAKRELEEECTIKCDKLEKAGVLLFEFKGNPVLMEVHVFKSNSFRGNPTETEEMIPRWFDIKDIPYDQMWLDDRYWWPHFLNDTKFDAYFKYDGYETIIDHKITINNDS